MERNGPPSRRAATSALTSSARTPFTYPSPMRTPWESTVHSASLAFTSGGKSSIPRRWASWASVSLG
jgi:hypothetical protein